VKPREVREIFFRRDDKEKTIEGSYFFYGSKSFLKAQILEKILTKYS